MIAGREADAGLHKYITATLIYLLIGMMKKLFLFALAAATLAACEKGEGGPGEGDGQDDNTVVIGFEQLVDFRGKTIAPGDIEVEGGYVSQAHHDVFWGKEYAEFDDFWEENSYTGLLFGSADGLAMFGSYYSDSQSWGYVYDQWAGFAVSKNCNDTVTAVDYANQFSAYAKKGAKGTDTFAVAYSSAWQKEYMEVEYAVPTIVFREPVTVRSLWITASSVAWPYETTSDQAQTVTITAMRNGDKVAEKVVALVDAQGNKLSDWTEVTLFTEPADRLEIEFTGDDELYPSYFCIDEITVELPEK